WLRHEVRSEDTMAHLALKYGTTIGHICRANRLHPQDVLQMHRHIWLPVPGRTEPCPGLGLGVRQAVEVESLLARAGVSTLPPHMQRQSAPNLDESAGDSDPLLITTRC
ncbi:hypothetical protein KR222_000611, partial [Zaprionus bogoriensis]